MHEPEVTYSIRDLSLDYTSRDGTVAALAKINVDIPKGALTILVGPSGSGKSSLLHCLSGLLTPTSGQITFQGEDVTKLSTRAWTKLRRRTIHVVTQQTILVPYLTVWENLHLTMQSQQYDSATARHYLAKMNLDGVADRYPKELSIGGRQRIAMVRALLGSPQVVLADEPTAALDRENSQIVMECLTSMAETGVTVIVATHDPFVMQFGETCLTLRDGRLESALQRDLTAFPQGVL